LENLLKNAQSNQDYNLKETIHQVSDFLLSDRGEYMRDRLTDEIVKGIEKEALSRIPNPFSRKSGSNTASTVNINDSSLSKLMGVWSTISQDQNLQPLEYVPLAGQIIAKPETQKMGRNIIWQLAQRAIARTIREVAINQQSPVLIPLTTVTETIEKPQPVGSFPSRQLNGKTW
jgi:hypothetical protein